MKKFVKIYLPLSILLAIVFLFIQPNPYFRRAIIFNTAEIADHTIFEERIVESGQHQPWKLSPEYNTYNLSDDDKRLLEEYKTVAYLVIKDTSIVFESYCDNYSADSKSSSFSMAKSIVSLLVGIAIDDGLINSVDDSVSRYIPSFANKKYTITIRDLLTMSSGLQWNESYYNPFSVTTKAYYGNNLNKLAVRAKAVNSPSKTFDYITANPQLLSIILTKVTHKPLSEYASEKLWKPLGAKHDATWSLDKKGGDEKAFCCFNSNARDFARIGQLILNNGTWNGRKIVSSEYLQEALMPAFYLNDDDQEAVDFYGYQWWISNYKDSMVYYARGILGQYIIAIPDYNMVIVRLGHKRSKERIDHHPADLFGYIDLALKIAQ